MFYYSQERNMTVVLGVNSIQIMTVSTEDLVVQLAKEMMISELYLNCVNLSMENEVYLYQK